MLFSRTLLKRHSVLPGFDLALGFTLFYLGLIVLIPLSAAFLKTFTMTWPAFWEAVATPRVLASYRLTFGASLAAATLNALFGLVVAWVLVFILIGLALLPLIYLANLVLCIVSAVGVSKGESYRYPFALRLIS